MNLNVMKKYMKTKNIICAIGLLWVQTSLAQHIEKDSLALHFGTAVKGETLEQSNETNAANTLFGRLSGLYVMQAGGGTNVLDHQATFNIRGISTFGSAEPLVLIDGVERNIENLAISEIESVKVLKNAVSAAIYGVRGANGVVLITTKRGTLGFRATANYKASFNTPFRLPKFVDAGTYAEAVNEAMSLDGMAKGRYNDVELAYFRNGTNRELYPNVDWQDVAYRDFGVTHQADVQFEGGSHRFKYYTALNYSNTMGILDQTQMFTQYNSQLSKIHLNLRANIDVNITNSTFLKVNLLARIKEQIRPGAGLEDIISRLYNTPSAAFPVKTGLDKWGGNNIYGYNPIADIADRGTVKAIRRSLLADMTLRQGLDFVTDGLYAEVMVAYDNMANYNDGRTRQYEYEMVTPVLGAENEILGANRILLGTKTELGWNSQMNNQEMYTTLLGKIGYSRSFGKHQVNGEMMYEQLIRVRNGRNATMKRQSIFGILNYQFDNRYNIDGVVNYAGTAVLPQGAQFNVYPAIGLGWTVSNEEFLKGNPIVDYLKVKTSYGLSGSDLFGHDLDRQYFGLDGGTYWFSGNNTDQKGLKEGNLAITNLLAEKSRKFDFGVDVSLWRKLRLSANYFYEQRSNILVNGGSVISGVIGIGVPQLCEGEVRNQGVEFSANISDRIKKFGYSFTGNITYAKNKIINNNEGFQPEDYLYKKGQSLNQYYGLQSDGFFDSWEDIKNAKASQRFGELRPGDIRYVDQNGDDVINEHDAVRLGYAPLPEIYYGFNVGLSYAGFSLNAQFQGVANRSIYLNTPSVYTPLVNNTNLSTWYLKEKVRWTPETTQIANLPRLTTEDNPNNFRKNDIWMANGSFFKLRNLELAYAIDKKVMKVLSMRMFLRGSNLFSVDHLGYADPENYEVAYPTMRSYSLGFEVKF